MKIIGVILCLVSLCVPAYGLSQQEDEAYLKETAENAVKGKTCFEDRVLALQAFVHNKVKPDPSKGIGPNAIMSVTNRLEAGVGWCHQICQVYMLLAKQLGYSTRMIFLTNTRGTDSPHTICEIYDEGHDKWVIIDPLFDVHMILKDRSLATRKDVMLDPSMLKKQPLLAAKEKDFIVAKLDLNDWLSCYYNPAIIVAEIDGRNPPR